MTYKHEFSSDDWFWLDELGGGSWARVLLRRSSSCVQLQTIITSLNEHVVRCSGSDIR